LISSFFRSICGTCYKTSRVCLLPFLTRSSHAGLACRREGARFFVFLPPRLFNSMPACRDRKYPSCVRFLFLLTRLNLSEVTAREETPRFFFVSPPLVSLSLTYSAALYDGGTRLVNPSSVCHSFFEVFLTADPKTLQNPQTLFFFPDSPLYHSAGLRLIFCRSFVFSDPLLIPQPFPTLRERDLFILMIIVPLICCVPPSPLSVEAPFDRAPGNRKLCTSRVSFFREKTEHPFFAPEPLSLLDSFPI